MWLDKKSLECMSSALEVQEHHYQNTKTPLCNESVMTTGLLARVRKALNKMKSG